MPLLPVDKPTQPFWLTERSPLDQLRSTPDLPAESDIVIIGAGYAGVSLAYHLVTSEAARASPPSITILEARTVCSGATGRNGGHLRPDTYGLVPLYIQRHGLERATELAEFELAHLDAVQDVIRKEQIDCDLRMTRNMNVYLDAARGQAVVDGIDKLRAQGCSFVDDIHVAEDAEAASGVKDAKTALSLTAGSLWPYKFILGLLSKVLEYGGARVNVQTTTPVTSVASSDDNRHTITTPRGTITARKVAFTANGYTAGVLPEYAPAIIPGRGIVSHIVVPADSSSPPPPRLHDTFVLYPHASVGMDYLIARPDGSIVVGGARQMHQSESHAPADNGEWYDNSDDGSLITPTKTYFDGYMQRHFRGWEESGAYVKELWTGIMGYSSDSTPHVGGVPSKPGQFISAAFSGHGMPVIFLTTKGLVAMILEDKPLEDTGIPRIYKTTAARLEAARTGKEGGDILE